MRKADTAICPDCERKFSITRYGRRIPCPHCGTLLDVMPDDPPNGKRISAADWERGVRAKIAWLQDAAVELEPQGCADLLGRIRAELETLRQFIGDGA